MALLIKINSKERDYIGWSGVLLLLYALKTVTSCLMRMHTCSDAGKPDLEIFTSTVNKLAMFVVLLL